MHQGPPSVVIGRTATCEGPSRPWVVDAALCIRVMHVLEVVPRHGRIGVHPRFEARVPCGLAVHRPHLHQADRVATPPEGVALHLVGVAASREYGAGVNGLVERRHVLLDRVQPARGEGTGNALRNRHGLGVVVERRLKPPCPRAAVLFLRVVAFEAGCGDEQETVSIEDLLVVVEILIDAVGGFPGDDRRRTSAHDSCARDTELCLLLAFAHSSGCGSQAVRALAQRGACEHGNIRVDVVAHEFNLLEEVLLGFSDRLLDALRLLHPFVADVCLAGGSPIGRDGEAGGKRLVGLQRIHAIGIPPKEPRNIIVENLVVDGVLQQREASRCFLFVRLQLLLERCHSANDGADVVAVTCGARLIHLDVGQAFLVLAFAS